MSSWESCGVVEQRNTFCVWKSRALLTRTSRATSRRVGDVLADVGGKLTNVMRLTTTLFVAACVARAQDACDTGGYPGSVACSCGQEQQDLTPVDCTAHGDAGAYCVYGNHCGCSSGFLCEGGAAYWGDSNATGQECAPGATCVPASPPPPPLPPAVDSLLSPTELNALRLPNGTWLAGSFVATLLPLGDADADASCDPTPTDVQGPYHLPPEDVPADFPARTAACVSQPACDDGCEPYNGGIPLVLSGSVRSAAGACVALSGDGVVVDIWQVARPRCTPPLRTCASATASFASPEQRVRQTSPRVSRLAGRPRRHVLGRRRPLAAAAAATPLQLPCAPGAGSAPTSHPLSHRARPPVSPSVSPIVLTSRAAHVATRRAAPSASPRCCQATTWLVQRGGRATSTSAYRRVTSCLPSQPVSGGSSPLLNALSVIC